MAKEEICVSRKILADIGRGIYRTPANAIKELVSNAFDACAGWVRISTNSPYFDIFTCEDNGDGMNPDEFKRILKRIGSSTKRAKKIETKDCKGAKRPIIGKIGIGIMAVSQICDKFTVISKKKGEKELFRATIDLLQFEVGDDYLSGEHDILLGEYEMEILSASEEEFPLSYTKIIMEPLKEGFRKKLKEEKRKQIIRPKYEASKALDSVLLLKSLYELRDFKGISIYDYMIWELGLLCPIKYLREPNIIFPSFKFIKRDMERLESYNFQLFVDGIEIYKPICFSKSDQVQKEDEDFKVYTLPQFDRVVAGEQLKFYGYIYSQRVKIRPTDLQGILIRIKDVAIGNYDKSVLTYPKEEGPRFGMISGEIFVEKGLETALNIDRNSFNETHPHYQELQFELHKFIKEKVVKDMKERSKQRRRREKEEQISKELEHLSQRIRRNWDVKLTFEVKQQSQVQLYSFERKVNKLVFFTETKGWSKSEKERLLQMKSVISFILIEHFHRKTEANEIISDIIFGMK